VPPLAVDPETLSAAGSALVAAGDGLDAALAVLTAGFGANTGLDAAGTVFGLAYQSAAESLLKVAAAAINACRYNGSRIQISASNYSKAEVASTLGGGGSVLQPPGDPVKIAPPGPPGPPGTLGPGEPPPLLWALVQSFVDDVWPNGDVAALHAAAGCWRGFGATVSGMEGALNASKTLVGTQQIPESERINQVLSQIVTGIDGFRQQCGKMAASLDDFANEVAHAQNAIRDLLHRLGSLCDPWHDVVSIFDGDAIDDIKKIAEDIDAVMHNLGREARAMEQSMKLGMQVIDGLVVGMEKDMRGMFTHFLGDEVGNPVATVFDPWVNANEGVLKDVVGMAQAMVDLDPRWFLFDPKGAAATWIGMTKTGLINDLINPQEAGQANLQMLKSLLHLEDWRSDRPGLGAAENIFDVATLFLPGVGEASAGVKGAGAAARGAEAGGEVADAAGTVGRAGRAADELGELGGAGSALGDIGRAGSGLTKDFEAVTGDLPKPDPQLGGRPVGAPPPKPLEVPVEPAPRPVESAPPGTPPPESPTAPNGAAPGRPDAPVGPHEPAGGPREPASVPAASPREPVSVPAAGSHPVPAPAATGERVPSTMPQLAEHSPVPVSPSGSVVEPVPAAAHTPQSTPALTSAAPNASVPHFTPPGGRPPELPAPGSGGWRGPNDGGLPRGQPPHNHGPHGLDHGTDPGGRPHEHRPSHDGAPHGPGDGSVDHYAPGDGHHPTAIDSLTSDDVIALADYTGSGYAELNGALRSDAMDASQHARVEALNDALEKLPAYQGPVIRGTNLPPEVLAQYRPGEVITEDAFLSTTTNTAVARSPTFAGNVEFRILSSTGRDISPVSMFPGEQEILFPAGTKFYVVSKILDPLTGRTVIRMVER
jgi:ADP-ribosyltransferase exoenzyme